MTVVYFHNHNSSYILAFSLFIIWKQKILIFELGIILDS